MVVEEGNYGNAVKKRPCLSMENSSAASSPKYDDNAVSAPGLSKGKDIKTIAHEVIVGLGGEVITVRNCLLSTDTATQKFRTWLIRF